MSVKAQKEIRKSSLNINFLKIQTVYFLTFVSLRLCGVNLWNENFILRLKRIILRLCLLFFIILSLRMGLLAQGQKEIRDPFLSLDDKVKLTLKPLDVSRLPYPIILQGIIWTKELHLAIINNETVEENQNWRDLKVEKIEKKKVILGLGSSHFEIPLAREEKDE